MPSTTMEFPQCLTDAGQLKFQSNTFKKNFFYHPKNQMEVIIKESWSLVMGLFTKLHGNMKGKVSVTAVLKRGVTVGHGSFI